MKRAASSKNAPRGVRRQTTGLTTRGSGDPQRQRARRRQCANSGTSTATWRTGQICPAKNSGPSAPYLRERGKSRPVGSSGSPSIHSVKSQAQWPRWFALAGDELTTRWRRVLFDRSHMAIDAAAGGLGIALESTLMTERELAQGVLVRPVRDAPKISSRLAMDCLPSRSSSKAKSAVVSRLAAPGTGWVEAGASGNDD